MALLLLALVALSAPCLSAGATPVGLDKRVQDVVGGIKKLEAEVGEIDRELNVESRTQRRIDLSKYDNVVYRALPEEVEKLKSIFRSEESSVPAARKAAKAARPATQVSVKSRKAAAAHRARKIAAKGKPRNWKPTSCGERVSAASLGLRRGPSAAKAFKSSALLQTASAGDPPVRAVPGVGAAQKLADNGRTVSGSVAGVEPFVTVYKDGFFEVGCMMDSAWKVGDKFGDEKDNYKWGKTTNVSVALYEELVLEDSQEKMSPKVCFSFCRSVPGMGFFGIRGGSTCYCTPYYSRVAGGESDKCSMMCPGSPGEVCGGKEKSNIFEMHSCGDREEMLAKRAVESGDALTRFYAAALFAKDLSTQLQDSGAKLKEVAGLGGDSVASGMGMMASVYAGDIMKTVTGDCIDHYNTLLTAYEETESVVLLDMKQAVNLARADEALEVMDAETEPVDQCAEKIEDAVKLGHPTYGDVIEADSEKAMRTFEEGYGKTLMQYYPIMYVLKNSDTPMQSVCEGTGMAKPVAGTMAECAQACDELVYPEKCMGFNFFDVGSTGSDELKPVCFLFKDVKAATTYDCKLQNEANEKASKKKLFVELATSLRGRAASNVSSVAAGKDKKIGEEDCKTVKALVAYTGMTCETLFGEGSSVKKTCKDSCGKSSSMKASATCLVKLSSIVTGIPNLETEKKGRCFGGRDAEDTSSPSVQSPFLLPFDGSGVVLSGDVSVLGRDVLEPVIWASSEEDV